MLKEKTPAATGATASGKLSYEYNDTINPATEQAFNPELSIYFGGICNSQKSEVITLQSLIDKTINSQQWSAAIKAVRRAIADHGKKSPQHEAAKLSLPYFIASGIYKARNNAGLMQSSGLVQVDIDDLSKFQLIQARLMLQNDKHCIFGFTSPSGNGFKMLCRANFSNNLEYKSAWHALAEHYKKEYNLEIDAQAKALSQACFISSDTRAIVNLAAIPINYSIIKEQPTIAKQQAAKSSIIPKNRAESYCKAAVEAAAQDILNAPKGSGNHTLNCKSLHIAQYAHTGGITEAEARTILVDAYLKRGGHNRIEAEKTFKSGWRKGIANPKELENREVS